MATGLHVATVAFSVRNMLALHGRLSPAEVLKNLQAMWDPRLELSEVLAAMAELTTRGMILADGAMFSACDSRMYKSRGANGRMLLAADDPRAWEGWR